MFRRLPAFRLPVALALGRLSLTACAQESPPASASVAPAQDASSTAGQATPSTETPSAAQQSAAAAGSETEQATASQESTDAGATADKAETGLERLAQMPASQQLPSGKWKPGTHYVPLVPALPTNVGPGKVEVAEVFWYGCGHCYSLEPFVASWLKNKPDYAELVRVPVMWGPVHKAHARLFYMLQALNRMDLHEKVFDAIHKQGNMLVANNEQATRRMQADFLKSHGVSAQDFDKAWDSFSVNAGLQRAEQLTQRYKVDGVPLVVINGKYSTDVGKAGGPGQLLQLINDLAASEKSR